MAVPAPMVVARCGECDQTGTLDADGLLDVHMRGWDGVVRVCEGSGAVPTAAADDGEQLIPPMDVRAGDVYLSPDGRWHRATLDAVAGDRGTVGVQGVLRYYVKGVARYCSEFAVLRDEASVLLLRRAKTAE